ncbi:MAG: FtsX-like permease family protein [Candidatus Margulisbacteria bacterium]|nr:FtsX-like permease family protein [Candidatus Margulisiibacteriota bacterium]
MPITLKIAWRNIFRHKGKSFVIGTILFLGALIMTVGNGVITGLNKGLQDNIVNSFTGDIVIISSKQIKNTVIMNMMGEQVELISNYSDIKKILQSQSYIDKFVPLAQGTAMLINEDGEPDFNFLMGVDFEEYNRMFNNCKAIEGRLLLPKERGLLLTDFNRKMNYEFLLNYWVIPENTKLVTENLSPEALESYKKGTLAVKDKMVFMGMNDKSTAMDIMPPVRGIIKFKALNSFWGILNIIDIESFRECFGYVTAGDSETKISEDTKELLSLKDENLESMFSNSNFISSDKDNKTVYSVDTLQTETKRSEHSTNWDNGIYNQIYVKLKNGQDLKSSLIKLNKVLQNSNLGVKAISWKQALGEMADMATLIKGALFVFVMFIFFVAIIIIMNTLSMAALERIPEIGMMRAVGARKRFISLMFFYETFMLSFSFGGIGIASGALIIKILNLLHITTTNEILQLVYGGERFHPFLTSEDILLCIIQLFIVTLLAVIYPIIIARRITPLEAIARD